MLRLRRILAPALSLVLTFALAVPPGAIAQSFSLSPVARQQFLDVNGHPLAGGQLFTYTSGTNIPLTSYKDGIGTANTNPIILDSGGFGAVWLSGQAYTFTLKDSTGVQQWSVDGISSTAALANAALTAFTTALAGAGGAGLVGYGAAGTGSVLETVGTKLGEQVSIIEYGADKTGVVDMTTSFNKAVTYAQNVRGGANIIIPCGTYLTNGAAINISKPGVNITAEGQGCVTWNYTGTQNPLTVQMVPFTTNPAGQFSGFTLIGTAAAADGILSGQIVSSHWHDINIAGFKNTTAGALHLHNLGTLTTWTERNTFINVSVGGLPGQANAHGFLLDSDNAGDSFGYNRFLDIKCNTSTAQECFTLGSGFFYNSILNLIVNMDNLTAGTVGAIAIRSAGNWDGNKITISGEGFQTGSGTGTQYAVQVDAGGRFSNLMGSTVNMLAPGGAQLAWNVIPAATNSPNVTLIQGSSLTSFDTGTFTLNGIATHPQPIQRGNYGSIGLLMGNNIEAPYFTMFQGTGDELVIGTVPTGQPISNMIQTGKVDEFGQFMGSTWTTYCSTLLAGCNAPGTIDGSVAQALGGWTSTHRSGFSNSYFLTTTGINESMSGDPNFSGGRGFVEGSNIAHPFDWGYILDPVDAEWSEKSFQTSIPTTNTVAKLLHGGNYQPKGHLDQMTTPGNIAGTCSLSTATSCAWTFPAAFTVGDICVGAPAFSSTVNWWVTSALSTCTVTYTTAVSGTFNFVVVGNPQ
jgi:hypothetical protein